MLDGTTCVPAACGVGPWGNADVSASAWFVASGGSGDGTEAGPMGSVQEAADAAAAEGGLVAVSAGVYAESLALGKEHDGVRIVGRCAAMVTLDGSDQPAPAIQIDGREAQLEIGGIGVTGGTVGVWSERAVVDLHDVDVFGNEENGVLVLSGEVAVSDSVVRETYAKRDGSYGQGIEVESGGHVTVTGSVISGNVQVGVMATGEGTEVSLTRCEISDTQASPSGGGGEGLTALDGATLVAEDCLVAGNRETGALVAAASMTLVRSRVEDTVPGQLGFGRGASSQEAGILTLTDTTLAGNTELGVYATGAGTLVVLEGTTVSDTRVNPLAETVEAMKGHGVFAELGASVTMTGSLVTGNVEDGVLASDVGTLVDMSDTTVSDTVEGDQGIGRGVEVLSGASLIGRRVVIERNVESGLVARDAGTQVTLTESSITDTLLHSEGHLGRGATIADGASLSASACTIAGNVEIGLAAIGAGTTVTLDDVDLSGNLPLADGTFGRGLEVEDGAVVTGAGCRIEGNSELGVMLLGDGASLSLTSSTIADTHPRPDGTAGRGIEAEHGASLALEGCVVEGNTEAGIYAFDDTTLLALLDTQVTRTLRGRDQTVAVGVGVELGATLVGSGLAVSETQGPGLLVVNGVASCSSCSLVDNGYAGLVVLGGVASLTGSSIQDNLKDPQIGGGFGAFVSSEDPVDLTLTGNDVGPHSYAAVWLDGVGRYDLQGNTLAGGAGVEMGGALIHGNALFAWNGVTPWDGETGLNLQDNVFAPASGITVLLHDASAAMTGNIWRDPGVDVRQQACDDVPWLTDVDLAGATTTEICSGTNTMIAYDATFPGLFLHTVSSE